MPPQETAQVSMDLYQLLNELIPFFATAGGIFATYIALGKWIKAWIIKDCITSEQLLDPEKGIVAQLERKAEEKRIKLKAHYDRELESVKKLIDDKIKIANEYSDLKLQNHKEQTTSQDEADKKWLRGLQEKIERLQIRVGE